MPVMTAPINIGMWKSRYSAMIAPRNSARSVAIAPTSLTIHIAITTGWGALSRESSARFFPVTMPSFAESP